MTNLDKENMILRIIADSSGEEILPNKRFNITDAIPTIRNIAVALKITERECELAVSSLIAKEYLNDPNEFVGPKTTLQISDVGLSFFKTYSFKYGTMDKDDVFKTHVWHQMGGFSSGAGAITRTKWYPMGSMCRRCGVTTHQFKIEPTICPKWERT